MFTFSLQILPSVKTTFDASYFIGLAIIILCIVILRIYSLQKDKKSGFRSFYKSTVKRTEKIEPEIEIRITPDRKELKKVEMDYGFSKAQIELFTKLCIHERIQNPLHLVHTPASFESFIIRNLELLEQKNTSKEIEQKRTILFTIRELVENTNKNAKTIDSTRSLKPGLEFTLITKKNEHYPCVLTNNSPQGLEFPVPRDIFGNQIRLPLFSKVEIFFYLPNGKSYRTFTRVHKYYSDKIQTLLVIQHTDKIKSLPDRKHERKNLHTPANFCFVTVANIINGKQTEQRFYPSGKMVMGEMLDISAGGCSISTKKPLNENDYIQIECIIENGTTDTIIGKVVKLHEITGSEDTLMHVRFSKMPRTAMNRIFSFIYNSSGESNT